jgi:hypothetical protein
VGAPEKVIVSRSGLEESEIARCCSAADAAGDDAEAMRCFATLVGIDAYRHHCGSEDAGSTARYRTRRQRA